jgi:hypothetical protein
MRSRLGEARESLLRRFESLPTPKQQEQNQQRHNAEFREEQIYKGADPHYNPIDWKRWRFP